MDVLVLFEQLLVDGIFSVHGGRARPEKFGAASSSEISEFREITLLGSLISFQRLREILV